MPSGERPLVVGSSLCGGAFLLDRAAAASCQELRQDQSPVAETVAGAMLGVDTVTGLLQWVATTVETGLGYLAATSSAVGAT